ncbi:hypothetical protein [Flavobacterium sp. IMCC34518]|uniref:hypothetical protein n=1 Tax=Flavobacterium sp. IMCC34518 TaxID=3003623 RepID=UPI00248252D1|nr:hypothetical protein [Flavobacterium sp. IMCC34518]
MGTRSKYFFIAVVLIGSVGIWMPIGLEALIEKQVTLNKIPSNVTTYFVSLLFAGCIDYFLNKVRDVNIDGVINVFFNLITIVILGLGLVIGSILLNIYHHDFYSLFLGIIGVLISYRIWWIANETNPNFIPGNSVLGGNANNDLKNG